MLLNKKESGFTLLEITVAMAIIAIALTAMLSSQSQSLSLANEAKFSTTATLLAQSKMAEYETVKPEDLVSDSGDFGEDYPNYHWEMNISDITIPEAEKSSEYLKQFDLKISWGDVEEYQYHLRLIRFFPKTS
jgi:general secretion pathway protein I